MQSGSSGSLNLPVEPVAKFIELLLEVPGQNAEIENYVNATTDMILEKAPLLCTRRTIPL